jgi:hypothetical protein
MHARNACVCVACIARGMPKWSCLIAEWGAARGYFYYMDRHAEVPEGGSCWSSVFGDPIGMCSCARVLV